MVVTHDKPVGLVGQQDQLEADRRLQGEIEAGFALYLEEVFNLRLHPVHWHMAQVQPFDLHAAVFVDDLQQRAAGIPQE